MKRRVKKTSSKCVPQKVLINTARERFAFNTSFEPADIQICRDEETAIEIESLVQNAYVKRGYVDPQSDGQLALDRYDNRSITFLTRLEGELVGTLSIVIGDEAVSMPSSEYVDRLPVSGPVVEFTRLAVSPKFRGHSGVRTFELFKHVFAFVTRVLAIDPIIISVNPRHEFLYKSILFFERLPCPMSADGYGDIHAPAVPLILTNRERRKMRRVLGKRNPEFVDYMMSDESMAQSMRQLIAVEQQHEKLGRLFEWRDGR